MKLRFETAFRGYIFALVALLFFCLWGQAQTAPSPTNTARVVRPEPLLNLPAVLHEHKTLLSFGLDRVESLQPDLAGNPRWQYVASLIYIILAFYVSKFLDFLTRVWMRKWAARTENKLDDLLVELLDGPIKVMAFVIFLHIGLSVFTWPPGLERFLEKFFNLVVLCALTYILLKSADLSMGFWRQHIFAAEDRALDEQLLPLVRKSIKVFIVIIATLFILQNIFNQDVKTLIASLSIGGLAIGLAAQDTLANLFGAVAVFVDKPFRIGDYIKLNDAEGVVESIGLRSTRVRNADGHLITVPNKTMGNATITNIARRQSIRTVMNFGLTYDTPAAKMKEAVDILNEIFNKHPMTKEALVSFNRFADSALNIQLIHQWNGTEFKSYLAGMQELNMAVKTRFDAAGLNFAFPSQTVYLKQDSEWKLAEPSPSSPPHAEK